MSTAAIVPAAGRGERLGPGGPKALRLLAGEPLLTHAVRSLLESGCCEQVVVAVPAGSGAEAERLLHPLFSGAAPHPSLEIVVGGADRIASVAAALAVLAPQVDVVLVHDAARPLAPPGLFRSVEAAVRGGHDAVVPGLSVVDTIKRVDADGRVLATLDRTSLRRIQTPQGFRRVVLDRAHDSAGSARSVTDDAGLCEALGIPVHVIEGSTDAFKVTGPEDLAMAEMLLQVGARRASG